MRTIQTTLALLFILMTGFAGAQSYGEIRGIVKSTDLEPVPFAIIKVLQGNVLVSGGETDMDGKYSCKPLNPGKYELVITHPEFRTMTIRNIQVNTSEAAYVDPKLSANTLGVVDVTAQETDYTKTGVDVNVFHTLSLNSTELTQSASYERGKVKDAIEFMSAEVVKGSDGEYHVRGARAGASGYFVDGVRVMEMNYVPGLAVENISAFTGGVPAMYGDLTSGAVMITTRTYFSGMRDKNIAQAKRKEEKAEEAASRKAKEDELNRQKEIEAEKEAAKKKSGQ